VWRLCLVGPAGETSYEEQISATIRRHGLESRVEILRSQPEYEVVARMRRAALYVQPSLEEALGLALQEALFHGCACIGTRIGGIPELIEHERNGLLCTPDDAESVAAALDRLLADAPLRERFARAAQDSIRARGMTAGAMIGHYRELYRSLLP
jgi:glycosyltransferase involved in cell wall biosynthesis